MSEKPLTLPTVAHRIGCDYRTLKNWADHGLLGRIKFNGSGKRAVVTDEQAGWASTLVRLRRNGLDYKALKRVARKLRQGDDTCPICGSHFMRDAMKGEGGG